ncbi:MAG: hypothetical protein ACYS1C_11220, partial [Planctomycetota bacterium]
SQPATRPATQPATRPASRPAVVVLPPLPKKFSAVITAKHYRMAIIDGAIYRPGSLVGGTDPTRCWRVEAIEPKQVILRFADAERTMEISGDTPPPEAPGDPG